MSTNVSSEARPTVHVVTNDVVLPGDTNSLGTMFGGDVLSMMDKVASIAALRFCRQPVVTASTEHIDFRTPIRLGDIVEAHAHVVHTGRTSMIVRIDVYAERPLTGEREQCTTGYYSFVSIRKDGKPQPVPPLRVETDDERHDWQLGERIKQQIKERQAMEREG